jgi:plasmid stability protein
MPQLLVRDVPAEIVDALKRRAAAAGHSAEAEHRRILEAALTMSGLVRLLSNMDEPATLSP